MGLVDLVIVTFKSKNNIFASNKSRKRNEKKGKDNKVWNCTNVWLLTHEL